MRETWRALQYAFQWTVPLAVLLAGDAPTEWVAGYGVLLGWVLRGNWYARDMKIAWQRGHDRARRTLERRSSVLEKKPALAARRSEWRRKTATR